MKAFLFYLVLLTSFGFAHAQNLNQYTLEIKNISVHDWAKK